MNILSRLHAKSDPPPFIKALQPAQLLSEDDGQVQLGNVRWGFDEPNAEHGWSARFQNTSFDPSKVRAAWYLLDRKPPTWAGGHGALYFEMEPDSPVRGANGSTDKGLVVSFEARVRQGQGFNAVKGLGHTYQPIFQVATWKDMVQKTCRWEKHALELYRLDLTPDQTRQLFDHSIDTALVNRDGQFYHTLNNSCCANVVNQVNSVLPQGQKIREWWAPGIHTLLTTYPGTSDMVLAHHGLIAKEDGEIILPVGCESPTEPKGPDKAVMAAALGVQHAASLLPGFVATPLRAVYQRTLGSYVGHRIERKGHTAYVPSETVLQTEAGGLTP